MADEQANQQSGTGKFSKKNLAMLVAGGVALVLVSVVATLWATDFFSKSSGSRDAEESTSVMPAIYMTLTPSFIVNFNVNGRQRYLQAEISLMFRDPNLEQQLGLHLPAIRNSIVKLLNKQNFESLHTVQGKDALRKEIHDAISEILRVENALLTKSQPTPTGSATIEQVLFTNFVMQ